MNLLSKYKKLEKKINHLSNGFKDQPKKADDIYSMAILQPLLINSPYLPWNGGALRPICISYILNEIIINNRKSVIEFGAGLSTILMARMIEKNQLPTKITSVEHNTEWAKLIEEKLKKENLLQHVDLIHTNLEKVQTNLGEVEWYELDIINRKINSKKFDLIVVDGPPANGKSIRYSRYPAFTQFSKHFAEDYCLLLDDANRKGETRISKEFLQDNPDLHFSLVSETLGVFRTSINFNPIPIRY